MREDGITKRDTPTLLQYQLGKVDEETERISNIGDLLDDYWDAAYAEGVEDRTHDTLEASAQSARNAIVDAFSKLRVELEIVKKNAAKEIKRLRTENAALNIQLDAAKRDAERYAWARNPLHAEIYLHAPGTDSCKAICDDRLDAAIDASIQKEQP